MSLLAVDPNIASVNLTRPLGVEIEMLAPVTERKSRHEFQVALARILTVNGVPAIARSYSTNPLPPGVAASVEFDESLIPPRTWKGINWANLELKTKKLAGLPEFDRYVPRMLEICKFLNCGVNETTGLHVTLSLTDEMKSPDFLRSLLNLIWRFEAVLFGLVHPTRQACGYAYPMPDLRQLWNQQLHQGTRRQLQGLWSKNYAANIQRVFSPIQPNGERIEFRHHEGTLDAEQVRHWAILLNRLVDHAATRQCKMALTQTPNNRSGLEKMFVTVGLKSNNRLYSKVSAELIATRRYLLRRWHRLSKIGHD